MSDAENLRALLAEAREWLTTYRDPNDGFALYAATPLIKSIDAALAEPVVGCERCEETEHQMHLRIRASYDKTIADSWRAKVAEVERERDEARKYAEERNDEANKLQRFLNMAAQERDEARAELDFIKAEYGDADNALLTRDALLLKLRLLESEMDGERSSRRMYERAHDDILEALKRAKADAYHPEDGEPVALWGVKRLAKERDEARAEVARLRWGNEMACENTPTKGCECPGCGLARERAERGEDGP